MRVAILLLGNIRTWEYTKDSFLKTFSHLDPDIFVSTSNMKYDYHPTIKNRLQDYDDCILDKDEILSMFEDLCPITIKIEEEGDQKSYIEMRMHKAFVPFSDSFHKQINRLSHTMDEVMYYEHRTNRRYDLVIKTRMDLLYESNIDMNTWTNGNIHIDSGNVYPNDCFIATTPDNMIVISSFQYNEIMYKNSPISHLKPPHGMLEASANFHDLNFSTHKIVNCVVRKGNVRVCY